MKPLILTTVILLLAGCGQSTIQWQLDPADPNSPTYTLTGEAAETMAAAMAKNTLTRQGRASEVVKYNGWLYALLVILLVGGFAFWGFTRSRFGFVIPASAVGGIVFISFWAEYSRWISLGVLVISMALLVYKAVEYQKERNAST